MEKVYCEDCYYYYYLGDKFGHSRDIVRECKHPSNVIFIKGTVKDTPLKQETTRGYHNYIQSCQELNCDNKCSLFVYDSILKRFINFIKRKF